MGHAGSGIVIEAAQRNVGEIHHRARQSAQTELARIERVGIRGVLVRCERGDVSRQIRNLQNMLLLEVFLAEGCDRDRHGLDPLFFAPRSNHDLFKAAG